MTPRVARTSQLRALHWQKVALPKLEGSIWQQLPQPHAIDEAELRRLFTVPTVGGAAKGRSGLTTPRGVGGRAQKVAVLDLKRSNQISIALAKFKCPHSAVRDAILRLDETIIKAEDIGRLRQCAPSGEERELLQARRGHRILPFPTVPLQGTNHSRR